MLSSLNASFLLVVAICLTAEANTFTLLDGAGHRGAARARSTSTSSPCRVMTGIAALFTQGRIIRHRKITSCSTMASPSAPFFSLASLTLSTFWKALFPAFAF